MRNVLLMAMLLPLATAEVARAGEAPAGSARPSEASVPPEPPPLISGNRVFFGAGVSDQPFVLAGIGLHGGTVLALGFGALYDNLAAPNKLSVQAVAYAAYMIKNVPYFAMGPEAFFLANLGANPASAYTVRTGYALYYSSSALPFVIGFGLDVDLTFTGHHFRFSVVSPAVRFAFGI